MDTFLSLFLLIVGTVATLSAFGGETWRKGEGPLRDRITRRGWVSLTCLVAALAAGIWKEARAAEEADTLRQSRAQAELDVKSANKELGVLRSELTQTRDQLSEQGQINLMTVLSAGSPITEVVTVLRLPVGAGSAKDAIQLLFPGIPSELRNLVRVHVEIHPVTGIVSSARLTYTNDGAVTTYTDIAADPRELSPELILPPCVESKLPIVVDRSSCQRSDQDLLILQKLPVSQKRVDAGVALLQMANGHLTGTISLRFSAHFQSERDIRQFLTQHTTLKLLRQSSNKSVVGHGESPMYIADFSIPKSIRSEVNRYWAASDRPSRVNLFLGDSHNLMLWCEVAARDQEGDDSRITIVLAPKTKPKIALGFEEIQSLTNQQL